MISNPATLTTNCILWLTQVRHLMAEYLSLLFTLYRLMRFWSEPFLWIHLAGLAVVPLSLQIVWLGLAVGKPLPIAWLELFLVAVGGILPPLLMQWLRPFDIFSLLLVAVKPEQLTTEQRQMLSLFKTRRQQILSLIAAIVMLIVLWQLARTAPIAAIAASFFPQNRLLGLLIATMAFLLSNLFVQVPFAVLGILLTSPQQFAATIPLTPEQIRQFLTVPGFKVNQFLSLGNQTDRI